MISNPRHAEPKNAGVQPGGGASGAIDAEAGNLASESGMALPKLKKAAESLGERPVYPFIHAAPGEGCQPPWPRMSRTVTGLSRAFLPC